MTQGSLIVIQNLTFIYQFNKNILIIIKKKSLMKLVRLTYVVAEFRVTKTSVFLEPVGNVRIEPAAHVF